MGFDAVKPSTKREGAPLNPASTRRSVASQIPAPIHSLGTSRTFAPLTHQPSETRRPIATADRAPYQHFGRRCATEFVFPDLRSVPCSVATDRFRFEACRRSSSVPCLERCRNTAGAISRETGAIGSELSGELSSRFTRRECGKNCEERSAYAASRGRRSRPSRSSSKGEGEVRLRRFAAPARQPSPESRAKAGGEGGIRTFFNINNARTFANAPE